MTRTVCERDCEMRIAECGFSRLNAFGAPGRETQCLSDSMQSDQATDSTISNPESRILNLKSQISDFKFQIRNTFPLLLREAPFELAIIRLPRA